MNAPVVKVAKLPTTYMQPAARARWLAMGERNGIRGEALQVQRAKAVQRERSVIGRTAIIRAIGEGKATSTELAAVLASALKTRPCTKATSSYLASMVEAGAVKVVQQVYAGGRSVNVYEATEAGRARYS